MYIQFSDPLNAQTKSPGIWERLSGRLAGWGTHILQRHHHRQAARMLAELDERLLRDVGKAEAASRIHPAKVGRNAESLDLRKQLLRAL